MNAGSDVSPAASSASETAATNDGGCANPGVGRPPLKRARPDGRTGPGSARVAADGCVARILRGRLLAMAQRYQSGGAIREATELYWVIAEEHPDTPEADASKAVLLELAASYERSAAPHTARSIYERLLADGAA